MIPQHGLMVVDESEHRQHETYAPWTDVQHTHIKENQTGWPERQVSFQALSRKVLSIFNSADLGIAAPAKDPPYMRKRQSRW